MASQTVFTERDLEKQSASSVVQAHHGHGHRKSKLGSANPLGLLAFGQALFFLSILQFAPRGVTTTNIVVGNMIWMGGFGQVIAGIIDFCAGNTFGATVFSSYGAFNLAYTTIFIPGSGIIAAYSDPKTGIPGPEFPQAVSLFIFSWFIITFIFTVGACQSNWVLFMLLVFADVTLVLLAVGFMINSSTCFKASGVFGLITAATSLYAASAYLYADGATPFTLPLFPIRKDGHSVV
ncbi:GPR1/FUN34/yaaH family-domain-containing protein [Xylaria sp. CBS 124048]|nr:GPR1/FUN34/yaaH family-domain-containing protein [Xylaria sp. CBS 124048]